MNELFRFDTYFIHKKLAWQILNASQGKLLEIKLAGADNYSDNLRDLYINHTFVDSILAFLRQSKTPSLEEKLFTKQPIKEKELIWFENHFYFKGIGIAKDNHDKGISPSYIQFHTTLKRYGNLKVEGKFNFDHTINTTALDRLSGQQNKFLLGYVENASKDLVTLRPILIGDKY